VIALALLVVAGGGCRTAVAGRRCRTTELGQDSLYVLKCTTGRWRRVITKQAAARAIAAIIQQRAEPVLGADGWAPDVEGFGVARPSSVFYGGDPTGIVESINWTSWGGATAEGDGIAYNEDDSPDGTVAGAPAEPAHIVAWDLGDCHGRRAYLKVGWYFSRQSWTPGDWSYDICDGFD
jgi:hypothetical protein